MHGNTKKRKPPLVAATRQAFRYRQLAGEIEKKILEGTYQAGEKLPSIRRLHRQTNLSISTVYQAYVELENSGFVEARPKSGYYVRPVSFKKLEAPALRKKTSAPRRVNLAPVINSVPNFQNPLGALMPEDKKRALDGLSRADGSAPGFSV